MDEEAKKGSTDCVYFLASPLTCKKGNNCEFRHSEAARMNPRDCWYWIHSTCRNPNCSFRHPPLEGKAGTAVSPQPAAAAPLAPITGSSAAALASKSKTPCYFFSQGNCTKGDKCPFMHASALPASTDAASQFKPPKPPEANLPIGNRPLVVLKSVASNVSKAPLNQAEKKFMLRNDSQPINSKPSPLSVQEKPQVAKTVEQSKASGSFGTINPYRMEKTPAGRKGRVTLFSDAPDDYMNLNERRHDVLGVSETRQGHSGRKQQQQFSQHEKDHSVQAGDYRYQNGYKSGTWQKIESSSLENDGSDHSSHGEDGYSSHGGSKRRHKMLNDKGSQVYRGRHNHVREGINNIHPTNKQPRFLQHGEQQVKYESDYNGTSDHFQGVSSGGRINVRDGQRMISEGYTSSIDLRDHLMKRRMDDRAYPSRNESLSRQGPLDIVDTHSLSQRRDDGFTSKDPRGRLPLRGVDHRGIKRLRHDGGASPDGRPSRTSPIRHIGRGRSPDRALHVVSPNRLSGIDLTRNEAREKGSDWYASKTAPVSNVRSHLITSQNIKSEYVKEEVGFTGPKSLAQIKAEKKDGEVDSRIGQGLGDRVKQSEENRKVTDSRQPSSPNEQQAVALTSRVKRPHAERAQVGKREHKPTSSNDFEGPKPLSLLLKGKQKVESATNGQMSLTISKDSKDLITDSNREVEDGEVRDEEDDYMESPNEPLQENLVPLADSNVEAFGAAYRQEADDVQDEMGSSDGEIGLELGQSVLGDDDYELDDVDDDDDEDDFAKKLGGFYS